MPKRSDKKDDAKAEYIARKSRGESINLRELAEELEVSYQLLRNWKTKDKWDEQLPKKKKGGQPGNRNSAGHKNAAGSHKGAPAGNKNAEKDGAFAAMKFAPAAEGAFGMIASLLGGNSAVSGSKPGGLAGLVSGLFTGGQKAAKGAKLNIGQLWQGMKIGAGLGNQGTSFGNFGLSGTQAGGGGFFTKLQNGILGAIYGAKNRTGLASPDDQTMLSAIFRTTQQINNAKSNGGLFGMAKTAIGNTKTGQYFGGIAQNAGSMFGAMKGYGSSLWSIATGTNPAAGVMTGQLGGMLSGASSMLSGIWGPVLSGFGSLFAGAAPVIGVISGIIAVVSILGDHLDDIRGIIGNVFGDAGLAVFDNFMEKLKGIGDFISGLFQDGGVANALQPLRDGFQSLLAGGGFLSTLFGGEETGLAAFDGVVSILQSFMGIIGQIVDFSVTYVKPIIQEV